MYKLKVPISDKCPECKGQAYLPAGQAVSSAGEVYTRYSACPVCEGSGRKTRWVELEIFATLLQQATCKHEHISHNGGYHYNGDAVWDDIEEVCVDCGLDLDLAD